MSLNLDKSGWTPTTFGAVVRNVNITVRDPESAGIDRVIAMEHLDPGELKIQRWGDLADGTTFTRRVEPGQTLFGKRRAYQRKVAYAEFAAICSGDILVFGAHSQRLLPEFLPFLVQSDGFFEHALGTSAGSLSPRTNWRDLSDYEFLLPGLEAQKRISDLLWGLERHLIALTGWCETLNHASDEFMSKRFASMPTTVRLGDITSTRSGPSFAATDVFPDAVADSIPVMGIPNTKTDGSIDLSGVGHVRGLPASTATIDDQSLVLIRTNGNRNRIGNVYLPPAEASGFSVSAFQFLMHVAKPIDRRFVYWALKTREMQARMSESASGSTGLGNLAVRWLNEQTIPWSNDAIQRDSLVRSIQTHAAAAAAIEGERAALTSLKSSLLADIFGGA